MGLGVPVVSYAPRPMIMSDSVDSRVIIVLKDVKDWTAGSQHIMSKGGSARRNASRTRVDSPVARAAMYRDWANRQPGWDKQAQGDCADGRLARVG